MVSLAFALRAKRGPMSVFSIGATFSVLADAIGSVSSSDFDESEVSSDSELVSLSSSSSPSSSSGSFGFVLRLVGVGPDSRVPVEICNVLQRTSTTLVQKSLDRMEDSYTDTSARHFKVYSFSCCTKLLMCLKPNIHVRL